MNILVTGGAGYIGGFISRKLASEGHKVVVLDSMVAGHKKAAQGLDIIEVELTSDTDITQHFHKHSIETVVHCAALASVPDSLINPGAYWSVNLGGTGKLLRAMASYDKCNTIIFSSTAAVYHQDDTARIHPMTPYGSSKLAAEYLIRDYCGAHGLKAHVFRYYCAAGACETGEFGESRSHETHLIPCLMNALYHDTEFNIYGSDFETPDGTAIRDFVHVDDIVEAHLLALDYLVDKPSGHYSTCDLGTGKGWSVQDVVNTGVSVSQRTSKINYLERRPGDPAYLVSDPSEAEKILGWKAKKDLSDMVKSYWKWKTLNPGGY